MIDKIENAPGSEATEASPKTLSERQKNNRRDFTPLTWFSQQGAQFVRVAAWNAKVNSPGKQPIDKAWQVKPLTANEVSAHVINGGNVGMLCGKPSSGLCLLDVDDHLGEFLEYFPGLMSAPIITRSDAPNRGKIVLKIIGETPKSKKWHDVHLEFLGTGNQGVIPPSIHPAGAAYELRNADKPVLQYDGARLMHICDVWEKENIGVTAPDPVPEINSNEGRGKVSRRTRDFLEYGAGEGSRNNRLFISACDLNGCAFSLTEAESMLLPVCIRIGMTEKEAQDTIKSAYSQGRIPANSHAFEFGGKHKSAVAPLALNMEKRPGNEDAPAFPITCTMPELPQIACLSDSEIKLGRKVGKFIDDYLAFAMKDSPMSPPLFHQTYGLAILSTAVARRVYVRIGTKEIYPNLYAILSAPSTLYTKTTSLKTAVNVLEAAGLSHLLLPDGVTPQSLITELSNRPQDNFQTWTQEDKDDWQNERLFAAQRAWWMDEAASLFSWFQQKHLADLKNIILKFYECERKIQVSTQIRGRETVRNIYLTICGPTTPAALRPHLKNPEYWHDGLFARFLLVTPDTAPVRVFFPDPFPIPPALIKHLNKLSFERLEMPKENITGATPPPPAIEAILPPEVKKLWDNFHAATFEIIKQKKVPEKLWASYGRFPEKAIKIAMLLAVSDWVKTAKGAPLTIEPAQWFRAQEMTEGYRASLHRMIEEASLPVESDDDELVEKIINRVQTSSRNSRRELAIDLHMQTGTKRTLLDSILDQLLRDEVLIEKEVKKERGPATVRLFSRVS